MASAARRMSGALSVYLDLLRFLAAVVVFLHHMPRVSEGGYQPFATYGEDAVMLFFVLSGFVIAYVTDTKERDPGTYMASRFARLYSVAVPALILTLILDSIGRAADPTLYGSWYDSDYPLVRLIASLTFTNEIWSLNIRPFGNPPYWSISYEFWYYVFFAILMFARRWWLIALWAVFVGPLIVLLLPVWLAGVLIYRVHDRFSVPLPVAWAMALLPIATYVGCCAVGMRE
ncbi:MAG TPA: acyltransferase, partial [Steroidobacteraceae bacterium]